MQRVKNLYNRFIHPDFTVGFGISPNQSQSDSWTITTGEELHLASKTYFLLLYDYF